ncbi:MAG TPA: hypothetical protein VH478_17430, partial [Trebonia sp.]|nr:hypothetical protein [Trebonia sp.]
MSDDWRGRNPNGRQAPDPSGQPTRDYRVPPAGSGAPRGGRGGWPTQPPDRPGAGRSGQGAGGSGYGGSGSGRGYSGPGSYDETQAVRGYG